MYNESDTEAHFSSALGSSVCQNTASGKNTTRNECSWTQGIMENLDLPASSFIYRSDENHGKMQKHDIISYGSAYYIALKIINTNSFNEVIADGISLKRGYYDL